MKLPGDLAVSNRINGLDSKPVRIAPSSAVNRRQEQAAGNSGPADNSSDVQLTGRAGQLAEIAQSLRALPPVDELRVAMVKKRLEDGEYQVDPQRIADKLLHLEGEFQRVAPLDRGALK